MKNFPLFSVDDVFVLLNISHLHEQQQQKNHNSYIPIP